MMPLRGLLLRLALVVAAAPAAAGVAAAHDHGNNYRQHGGNGHHHHSRLADHDEVRRAVERGELRPLAELLTMIRDKLPGEITAVEIERDEANRWVYEFHVVDKRGRLLEVYVDPTNGKISETKEK